MALTYGSPDGGAIEGGSVLRLGPVLAWAALWLALLPWHVDDAGITYAYARSLAAGEGFRAFTGGPVAEGFSNPAWTLLLAALASVGAPIAVASKWLQATLGALTLLGVHALVRHTGGRRDEATAAALATAVSAPWVVWSAGGLETALVGATSIGMLCAVATGRPGWVVGACAGVVGVARPEGPLLAVALLCCAEVLQPAPDWARRRYWAWSVAVLCVAGWFVVRVSVFDALWPTAWWAKVSGRWWLGRLLRGALYTGAFAAEVALPLLALGWGAALGMRRLQRMATVTAIVVGVQVLVVTFVGGDWMRHGRLLAPMVPLLAAGSVPGLLAALYRPRDAGQIVLSGAMRHLGWGFLAVYTGVGLLFWQAAVRRPPLPLSLTADTADLLVAVGPAWCDEERAHVATPDVGALVHRHPDARVLDLVGLLDPGDARARGSDWWPRRLTDTRPQVVLLHGPWTPRTGLHPDVIKHLGYDPVCSRSGTPGPHERRHPPTLYRRADCTEPLEPALVTRIDAWCARPR